MNTQKIAALYASPIFNTLLRFPDFDTSTTLTKQLMGHVMDEAGAVSEDGRRYYFDASYPHRRDRYTNDEGRRASGFIDENTSKRVGDWMLSQMHGWAEQNVAHLRKGMPEQDVVLVSVWGSGRREDGIETLAGMRYGAKEDFEVILRGMASIRRKRRKQAKKLEAQLRAYHYQQQEKQLRNGQWLGAERALTTASRVSEPGVPFLGDADLTAEQRKGLHYWAVPENFGMSAAFPTGTGIALKLITSSKQLIDGAVYLSQVTFGKPSDAHYQPVMRLGRLDLSRKTYGMMPLFQDDKPDQNLHIHAEWKQKEGAGYEVKLLQVVYYTTRNAAEFRPLSGAEFLALPMKGQRVYDQQLELANAA
jgi:hypothetical protein